MIPIGDVIPTRTRPALTAVLVLAALALIEPPALRPWTMAWLADGLAIGIFGRALEDRMGRARFALFAVIGAGSAAAVAALIAPIPLALVTAGGLAAAVSGGHLARFPGTPVLALVPVPSGLHLIEIPAWFIAGVWGVVHLAIALRAETPAATLAPLAGWVAAGVLGVVLARPFSRGERDHIDWWGGSRP
jgi:membrane associated rhomboid family serine protease